MSSTLTPPLKISPTYSKTEVLLVDNEKRIIGSIYGRENAERIVRAMVGISGCAKEEALMQLFMQELEGVYAGSALKNAAESLVRRVEEVLSG